VKGVFKDGISGGDNASAPKQAPAPEFKKNKLAPDEPISSEIIDATNLELEPMSKVPPKPSTKPANLAGGPISPSKSAPQAAESGLRGVAQASLAGDALKPGKPDADFSKISDESIDPARTHVLEVRTAALRKLPTLRGPKAASVDELAEAERALVTVLSELSQVFEGEYFPLESSDTYPMRPGGMTSTEAGVLRSRKLLFESPDPQARGVFAAESGLFAVQINDADHVRLVSVENGPDIKASLLRLGQAESIMRQALRQSGQELEPSDQISAVFEVTVKVPLLKEDGSFEAFCGRLKLTPEKLTADTYRLISAYEQGTDAEKAGVFADSVRQLIAMEIGLEAGAPPPPMDAVPPPKAFAAGGKATPSTEAPSPEPAPADSAPFPAPEPTVAEHVAAEHALAEPTAAAQAAHLPVVTARIAHWS
jgi:creatine kinase